MKWKTALLSLMVAAAFLLVSGTPADAGISLNRLSSNRLASNRIAFNRIGFNRIAANQRSTNALPSLPAPPHRASERVAGDGAVATISRIELADGTLIRN